MTQIGAEARRMQWNLAGYSALLDHLSSVGAPTIGLPEFAAGAPGVWLRHDVEIDLEAAVDVARLEADAEVRAWYFVCPESPFIRTQLGRLNIWAKELLSLGHVVSLHMFLGGGMDGLDVRVARAAERVGIEPPSALTFHAPGLDAEILAQAPGGAFVYKRLAAQSCQYLSDSTSRWRWGDPWTSEFAGRSTQLLTHPFWWNGDRSRVTNLCQNSADHAAFLPQFRSEVLGL
jgi:hypothetical protein